jgi:hypothetical protein
MVMGDGNPTPERLLALAADADLARAIIDRTREALAYWPTLARAHGVAAGTVQLVSERLQQFSFWLGAPFGGVWRNEASTWNGRADSSSPWFSNRSSRA